MLNTLIIDDDLISTKVLKQLITTQFQNVVQVSDTASSLDEGIIAIQQLKPDLVFLDIKMPDKDGFEIFNELQIINFDIVFTTSETNFAIDAFKVNALDYLLKPVQSEDLKRAVNKALEKKIKSNASALRSSGNSKIGLPTSKGIVFVEPKDIIFCEASSNYTIIHFRNKKNEIISRTLKEVESALLGSNFFRIHKSYLINFDEINQFIKTDGGFIVMNEYSSVMLPVSKFIKEEMVSKLRIL